MTIDWPDSIYEYVGSEHYGETFDRMLSTLPSGLPEAGIEVVAALLRNELQYDEAMCSLRPYLIDGLETELDPGIFLIALGLIQFMVAEPTLDRWRQVREVMDVLRELGSWLADCTLRFAKKNPQSRDSLIQLAQEAISALDRGVLLSRSERHNKSRAQLEDVLAHRKPSLTDAFNGLNWPDSGVFGDEFMLYQILRNLDLDAFAHIAGTLRNPILLDTILWSSDAIKPFKDWSTLVALAPIAFTPAGEWTHSLLLPRLASYAMSAMNARGNGPQDVEQFQRLAAAVVTQFYERSDKTHLLGRWAVDMMHSLVLNDFQDTDQLGTQNHTLATVLEAIGRVIAIPLAETFLDYESVDMRWHMFLLQNYWAENNITTQLAHLSWFNAWHLQPDDWTEKKGVDIQQAKNKFISYKMAMPSNLTRLIMRPLLANIDPSSAWTSWWKDCHTLREIAEFGSPDVAEKDRYSTQADTSRLLLLVATAGLALIDGLVSKNDAIGKQASAALHSHVAVACREMRMIDRTLAADDWDRLWRNLVVRRMMWERRPGTQQDWIAFDRSSEPSASAYLRESSTDVRELLSIIDMALNNQVPANYLKTVLLEAGIELQEVLAQSKRLSEINLKKYPANQYKEKFSKNGLLPT